MLLEVSTTITCPMRCSYCPQDKIESAYTGPKLMSFDTFAKALANCPPGIEVSFAGYAEPYLNRHCSEMISQAYGGGNSVLMYTTGVGMTDFDAELLIAVQPRILNLHLPDGDGDMKAGKVDEAFAARLKRLAENVRGCIAVCYGSLHPALQGIDWPTKNYRLHSRAGNVAHLSQVKMHGPLKCRPAPKLDENVMLPDGSLTLCCQDWNLVHVIGNLLTQSWDQIHAGPALAAIRGLMTQKNPHGLLCSTCEFAERA